MSGYAILGWGSLLWDLDTLVPHVRGDWEHHGGPVLPMEFTRVSPKRKMGLVVCLDTVHGAPCRTHAIASARDRIDAVVDDLARRERAPAKWIGAVCHRSGHRSGACAAVVALVAEWCAGRGLTGAVWTDLASNFEERLGTGFSIPRAVAYLQTLGGDSLDEAVRYIENAPAATDTPLRRALAAEAWWQAEAQRLGLR